MSEEYKVRFRSVLKNVMPAVVVMFTGLLGSYLVYNSYLSDRVEASDFSALEPAAGDETVDKPAGEAAPAPATEEKFVPVSKDKAAVAVPAPEGEKVISDEGADSGSSADVKFVSGAKPEPQPEPAPAPAPEEKKAP